MRPDGPRDDYAGPETGPLAPFPINISGPVVAGFGRGSSELGIPTANIPVSGLSVGGHDDLASGVYFGFAGLEAQAPSTGAVEPAVAKTAASSSSPDKETTTKTTSGKGTGKGTVYPMVMSLGYNPFYKNTTRSVEVHVMHAFGADFYGAQLKLAILGFIRPEYDYVSRDALVDDINTDIAVARRSLERPRWRPFADDAWLVDFDHQQVGT